MKEEEKETQGQGHLQITIQEIIDIVLREGRCFFLIRLRISLGMVMSHAGTICPKQTLLEAKA